MTTLNARETQVLRELAIQPRGVAYFVRAQQGYANAVALYLAHLAEIGFAEDPINQNGPYRITAKGLQYLAALPEATPSRSFVQRDVWTPPKWEPARAGADSHRQYKSLTPGWGQA